MDKWSLKVSKQLSTYFFIAQLNPESECRKFNPGELKLNDGWVVDIYYDLICIWNPSVQESFDNIRKFVPQAFTLLIDLFSFHTKKIITFQLQSWVEAKDVSSAKNVIGIFKSNLGSIKIPGQKHPTNRVWRKVAKGFSVFKDNPNYRIAIKDYVSALRDGGDDAFFFAYRAVESICRSITGTTGDLKISDWGKMHSRLSTSETKIKPLFKASTAIRHGDVKSSELITARSNRDNILNISREVLKAEFKISVKGF
jgi:hypothetical protein